MLNTNSKEEKLTQNVELISEQKLAQAVATIEELTYTREEVGEAMDLSAMRVSSLVRDGSIPESVIVTVYGRKYYSIEGIQACITARHAKADARAELMIAKRDEQIANAKRREERKADLKAMVKADLARKAAGAESKARTKARVAEAKSNIPVATQVTFSTLDELLLK